MYSKKKHNIQFTKPNEPAFITRLKQQAGYIEGPNVDTKREQLPDIEDEDCNDRDDEKPTVVVMKEGDLTEEEANLHAKIKETEEALRKQIEIEKNAKADLSQKVIFKRKSKADDAGTAESSTPKVKKKKSSKPQKKSVLSFNDEEEEE